MGQESSLDQKKTYYHGTEARHAYAIMTGGFKLGEILHGRRLGRGLYVATRPESAVFWSHSITIKCTMQPGTRILWIQEGYGGWPVALLPSRN